MKKLDAYRQIVRDTLQEGMSDEDILMLMVVLHTHAIVLCPDISIEDVQPGAQRQGTSLSPLTRNHLAELFASLWRENNRHGDKDFWFSFYSGTTPYEVFEDIPPNLRNRAVCARNKIAKHELVEELIEE